MSVPKQFEHLRIQLDAIKSATNDFAADHCIGEGGYAKVFKGNLFHLNSHTHMAFKRLNRQLGEGDSEFLNEVITLSAYKHENIISLLGFCDEKDEKIFAYEHPSNRSLDLNLNNKDLTWIRRLKLCMGAAHGLAYLHNERVIHRDINSSNILLDENWNAKVADFGLSKFSPSNQKSTFLINNAFGMFGYCDPEYLNTGILRKDSDVYSFGVVLFEILCGRLCFLTEDKHQSLTLLAKEHYKQEKLDEIIWVDIKDEIIPSSLKAFATIAYACLQEGRANRPSMKDVARSLESALLYQIFTDGLEIPLSAILRATNNFAEDHRIGEGGFGDVYKGELSHSEKLPLVALKRLNRAFGQGDTEFWKEVTTLSSFRHENIVNLLGVCNERNEKILVYEYVPNKSLDFSLNNNHLTWVQRLKICIGAARGLAYLHNPGGTQESVLHLDIKSGNILLDENWNAKIADLGLSKMGVDKQNYTSGTPDPVGTVGYCDPLYIETGLPTKESDVYSFGVVLLEILSGRLCIDKRYEHAYLIKLARSCYEQNNLNGLIFGNIRDEINPTSLWVFTTMAYRCLNREREERPSMDEILTTLLCALECQVPPLPPPPYSRSINEYQRSLKSLHWEKTPISEGSLWDLSHKEGIQSRAPEIDLRELESLFCKHKYRSQPGHEEPKPAIIRLVHPDKASNCETMLRNMNIHLPDITEAILALDSSAMSVDQIYNLIEFCPTKEEMEMLKSYTEEKENLGKCEQFFLECTKIPRIESKLRVFTFKVTFRSRVTSFRVPLMTIKEASKEIRESTKLVKIMEMILTMWNKLNAGIARGPTRGFKLDSLEKLGDIYATDENITLLHFLCKVIAEERPELLDFDKDLIHLQDAYQIQIKSLYEDKPTMIKGFEEVELEFKASENDGDVSKRFRKELKIFLDSSGPELRRLISFFDEVDQYANSVVVYFGEDPGQCSWKQVISSLVRFIQRFRKAHDQNKLRAIVQKKKLEEPVHKSTLHIPSMKIKRDIAGNTLTTKK